MAASTCSRLSELPLELAVLAKCAAHWVATGLPLALISPVLALFVDLDPAAIPILMLSLLIGTPALSLIGAIAAALTLGARRPGRRVVAPGAAALSAAADLRRRGGRGERCRRRVRAPNLLLLGAVTLAALPLLRSPTAAALRQALD